MAKLLFYELVGDDKGKITTVHNEPETLKPEQTAKGILVDYLPEPENNGKVANMYCRPSTGEVWYEYIDMPIPPEVEQLKQRTADLEMAIASILGGAV